MSNNNYISHKGVITFFDDTLPVPPIPPPGGAVFRRPKHYPAWVSQIIGEYNRDELVFVVADE
jgi:hypothetical protein